MSLRVPGKSPFEISFDRSDSRKAEVLEDVSALFEDCWLGKGRWGYCTGAIKYWMYIEYIIIYYIIIYCS